MLEVAKTTGLPLFEEFKEAIDIPHTVSFAIAYRSRIDSFGNLPKEKRPPRNLWDKPYRLSQFLDKVYSNDTEDKSNKDFIELNIEDVD